MRRVRKMNGFTMPPGRWAALRQGRHAAGAVLSPRCIDMNGGSRQNRPNALQMAKSDAMRGRPAAAHCLLPVFLLHVLREGFEFLVGHALELVERLAVHALHAFVALLARVRFLLAQIRAR